MGSHRDGPPGGEEGDPEDADLPKTEVYTYGMSVSALADTEVFSADKAILDESGAETVVLNRSAAATEVIPIRRVPLEAQAATEALPRPIPASRPSVPVPSVPPESDRAGTGVWLPLAALGALGVGFAVVFVLGSLVCLGLWLGR